MDAYAAAVAASSPFLRDDRKAAYEAERVQFTSLANAVDFVNPSGRVIVEENADHTDWESYLQWVSRQELWQHWPALLVVIDDSCLLPPRWTDALMNIRHEQVKPSDTGKIKGLEYQHVALVLTKARYVAVRDGFAGSGRSVYNDYRLARIPFSRAKDTIATFVVSET